MNTFVRSANMPRSLATQGLRPAAHGLHPTTTTSPTSFRAISASSIRFASGGSGDGGGEPPRSESRPAESGKVKKDSSLLTIGGLGIAIGAVFLYMLSRPEKAAEVSNFGKDKGKHNEALGPGSQTTG